MAQDGLYGSYVDFKRWDRTKPRSRVESYAPILRQAGVPVGARTLEIGFGSGRFLGWAKAAGYPVCGLEILPPLVEAARADGQEVFLGRLVDHDFGDRRFDLVAAFDVFEHMEVEEIGRSLAKARDLLAPEGRILLKFPNGDSPFFGPYQHGDLTHRTVLNESSLRQIAQPLGLKLTKVFNPRTYPHGLGRKLRRWREYWLRDLIEGLVSAAYNGKRRPLDPDVGVVLVRAD